MIGIMDFVATTGQTAPVAASVAGVTLIMLAARWRRLAWPRRGALLLLALGCVILLGAGQAQAADGPVLEATLDGGDVVLAWTPPAGTVRLILVQSCPDDPYCVHPQPLDLLRRTATRYRVVGGVPAPGQVAVWRVGFWIGKRMVPSNTVAAVSYALE